MDIPSLKCKSKCLHEWIKYVGENGTTVIKRKINTIIEDARIFIV
jgi:hypothetical protein